MAVTARDGSLEWKVSLDLSEVKKQAQEMEEQLMKIGVAPAHAIGSAGKLIQEKQLAEIKKAQEKMTAVIEKETKERIDLSRKEADEWLKSGLKIQSTGTKAKQPYQLGSPVAQPEGINSEFKENLADVLRDTQGLDTATKGYIQELVQLQTQQGRLKNLQKELNTLNKDGKVTQEEYSKATEQIAGAQKLFSDEIALITKRQKEFDALKLSEIDSTKAQIIQVEQLKAEYISLSEAQKQSAYGQNLKAQITGLNTSIKQTQTELAKTNEVAQKAGTGVTRFFSGAWSYLRQLAYVLPGFGVAGIIGGIANALSNLIFGSGGFDKAVERIKNSLSGLSDEQIKQRKTMDEAASSYTRAVSLIGELRSNIDLAKSGYLQTDDVLKNFNDTFGKTAGHAKNLQEAEKKLNEQGEAYIQMTLQKAIATAALEQAGQKAFEIEKLRAKQQEEFLTNGDKFLNNTARNAYAMAGIPSLQKAANETADKMREDAAKRRKDEAIKDGEDEMKVYKDIFKRAQKQAAEISKTFKLKFFDDKQTKESKKEQTELNGLLEKRADFLKKVIALERDAKQSGLIQREREVDKINEKYDQQLSLLDELNKEYAALKPKAPEPLINDAEKEKLNAARAIEVANATYREDAKNYIDSLEQKRTAFDAITHAQQEASDEIVDITRQQYASQLAGFDTYADYIKSQIAALAIASTSSPLNLSETVILEKLKDELAAINKESNKDVIEDTIQTYKDAVQLANTYSDKKLAIEKKYQKAKEVFDKQYNNKQDKLYKERFEGLEKSKKAELSNLADEILESNEAYKKFSEGIEDLGKNATKAVIEGLKKLRSDLRLTEDQVKLVNKAIEQSEKGLADKSVQSFREVANIIGSLGNEINIQLSKTMTLTGQQIAGIVNNIATVFSSSATKSEKNTSLVGLIYTFVNSISSVVTTALQNKKDLESGLEPSAEAAKSITLALQAQNSELERQSKLLDDMYGQDKINGLLSLQDKLQAKQKETFEALKELNIDAIVSQGEYYVDSLFHGRDKAFRSDTTAGKIFGILNDPLGFIPKTVRVQLETIDTSGMQSIEDFVALLDEIKANDGKLNGKTIVEEDVKALEELVTNYQDLVDKQKELRSQLQQIFTATTASSIADSIISGFRQGKRTMEDFASDFEELMKNAMLNSIKFNSIEKPLQDFYDQFSKLSASDNILTSTEIENLKNVYADIIGKASQQLETLQDITNMDLSATGADSNSLTGAIKGMSEQTAEMIAGQFSGLRMTAIEQLKVATSSLDTLQRISRNTEQLYLIKESLRKFEINGIKVI